MDCHINIAGFTHYLIGLFIGPFSGASISDKTWPDAILEIACSSAHLTFETFRYET